MKTNMFQRFLTISAVVSAVTFGCQVGKGSRGTDSHVSDFSSARDCGMLVTIGVSTEGANVDAKLTRVPAPLSIMGQIIACGNPNSALDGNWHAIGIGIERKVIMIDDKKTGKTIEAQAVLDANGVINLYANNALVMKMGNVPANEIGIPVGLDSGLVFEMRDAANKKIGLTESKDGLATEQIKLWIVKN